MLLSNPGRPSSSLPRGSQAVHELQVNGKERTGRRRERRETFSPPHLVYLVINFSAPTDQGLGLGGWGRQRRVRDGDSGKSGGIMR